MAVRAPAITPHDAAALRLGRELKPGELLVDIAHIDRLLTDAKLRLAAAIEKEKSRAIRSWLAGEVEFPYLEVTPAMLQIVGQLQADGQVMAMEEIRRHGVEPGMPPPEPRPDPLLREFEDASRRRRITDSIRSSASAFVMRFRSRFPPHLGGISARVVDQHAALDFGDAPLFVVAEHMEARVPGSLDVASRLVSSALYDGMGRVYEHNRELFPGFSYSAVMDAATCEHCRHLDGTEYATWEEGEADLPGGGPNPLCRGDGRCRCRLVPLPLEPPDLSSLVEPLPPPGEPPSLDAPTLREIRPDPDFLGRVTGRDRAEWEAQWADSHGVTIAEYREAVDTMIRENLAYAELRIRANINGLEGIVRDGRFKSQFETDTSAGLLDPEERGAAERAFFSYPDDLPAHERPIYGYVHDPSYGDEGGQDDYGEIVFRLKQSVRERTTVTMGDSLGAAYTHSFVPRPINGPDLHLSVGMRTYDPLREFDYGSGASEYIEHQVHGGLSLDDVEEIIVPRVGNGGRIVAAYERQKAAGSGTLTTAQWDERIAKAKQQAREYRERLERITEEARRRGIRVTVDEHRPPAWPDEAWDPLG